MVPHDLARWPAEMQAKFRLLPAYCGNEVTPGVDESPRNRDWSHRPTTRDQARIEAYVEPRLTADVRILHVGIGNSKLAQRFAPQVAEIVGLTLSPSELAHAQSLALANYRPLMLNKYGRGLSSLAGRFDFIIDNNPTTFACCVRHFWAMMAGYRALLAPQGRLLADLDGLQHLATDAPELAHWRFDRAQWCAAGEAVGLTATTEGETLVILQRPTSA